MSNKNLRDAAMKTGHDILPIKFVRFCEGCDIVQRTIDRHASSFRIDKPHGSRAVRQPLSRLLFDLRIPIVWRQHLNRQQTLNGCCQSIIKILMGGKKLVTISAVLQNRP